MVDVYTGSNNVKIAEKTVAELLQEAAAALEEQQDAGYERATNMPDCTEEGRANRVCHFSARIGYFTEITSQGRYHPLDDLYALLI